MTNKMNIQFAEEEERRKIWKAVAGLATYLRMACNSHDEALHVLAVAAACFIEEGWTNEQTRLEVAECFSNTCRLNIGLNDFEGSA